MIYVDTETTDVYENFGTELYFATEKELGDDVFLLWRTSPTLMVGKYQNVREEVDLAYASKHGINLVRRQSGGGTIYTDEGGWQFTFIHRGKNDEISFEEYTGPILAALGEAGVVAEQTGRNDLTIAGKKFSGNAQFRFPGVTVHHGSMLYATDIEAMVASTTVDKYKIISKSIKSVRDRVTNISEHIENPPSPERFRDIMVENVIGKDGARYRLTDEDKERIHFLAENRFRGHDNVFGRDPKYNIETEGRFAGGRVRFKLDIKKDKIASAKIYGDFFASVDADTIENALIGVKYEKSAILDALLSAGLENAFFRISADEIASVISGTGD